MGTTRHLRGVLGMIHASGWTCGNHDSSARTRLCNTQHIESPLRGGPISVQLTVLLSMLKWDQPGTSLDRQQAHGQYLGRWNRN